LPLGLGRVPWPGTSTGADGYRSVLPRPSSGERDFVRPGNPPVQAVTVKDSGEECGGGRAVAE
jgi:hypothetical protein